MNEFNRKVERFFRKIKFFNIFFNYRYQITPQQFKSFIKEAA